MKIKILLLITIALMTGQLHSQTFEWAEQGGWHTGILSYRVGRAIQIDGDGNSYVAGEFSDTLAFGSHQVISNGGIDIFLAKFNSDGNVQWVRSYGATSVIYNDGINNYGLITDASGNSYVAGQTYAPPIEFGDTTVTEVGAYIVKYDTNGELIWARGNTGSLILALDPSGDLITSGTHGYGAVGDTTFGNFQFHIIKYTSAGDYQWGVSIDGGMLNSPTSIITSGLGDIYVAGGCPMFAGNIGGIVIDIGNSFIAKYNANGDFQWVKTSSGTGVENCKSIAWSENGQLSVMGSMTDEATFDGITLSHPNGGPIFTIDFILQYDADGNIQWGQSATGTIGTKIDTDLQGNAYYVGGYQTTAYFGDDSLTSDDAALGTAFIVRYNSDGSVEWLKNIYGGGGENAQSIVYGAAGDLYITGSFSGEANFDSFLLTQTNTNFGLYNDIFVTKLHQEGFVSVVQDIPTNPVEFKLFANYPNPFNPQTTISYVLSQQGFVKLSIYNVNGQLIETIVYEHQTAGNHSILWNANNVSSGVYFYRITSGNNTMIRKCLVVK